MLKCRDVAREASDYLDKAQPWPRRLGMWLHLLICYHCRRFLRHLRITQRLGLLRGSEPANPEEVKRIVEHACKHD